MYCRSVIRAQNCDGCDVLTNGCRGATSSMSPFPRSNTQIGGPRCGFGDIGDIGNNGDNIPFIVILIQLTNCKLKGLNTRKSG